MQKGLVNPHEEARRMVNNIISVDEAHGGLFKNMNILPQDGKITRNQAAKAFKIIGKLLGEPTNIEYLRRDKAYGTYHSEKSLSELEQM